MSLSKEIWEYHLTPDGWVEGSFYGDCLGGQIIRDVPENRVQTIGIYDVLPAPFAKPHVYDRILWESQDRRQVARLVKKFGSRPKDALCLTS